MDTKNRILSELKTRATALAVSGIALTASTAYAQDDIDVPPEIPTGTGELDQIIVFTKGGAKDLQVVPSAVTAITDEALQRTFAQDLRDVTQLAPNVSLEPVGIFQNSAAFFIRGLGTQDIESASDPVVAVLVDGVYQARVSTALSDFLDVETIQIFRGPQGTEFGHNSTAGVVDIRHRAPEFDAFTLDGGIQVGNFGRLDVKGVVNVPLVTEKVAARLAVKSTNFDGFWRNEFNDERRGGHDRLTIRPSLRIAPNENLDIILRGEYARLRDDTYPGQSHNFCRADVPTALGAPPPTGGFGPFPAANDLAVLAEFLFANGIQGKDFATAVAQAEALCGKPIKDVTVAEEHTFFNTEERGNFANNDIWGITAEVN